MLGSLTGIPNKITKEMIWGFGKYNAIYQGNAKCFQEEYEANYKANTTGSKQITKQNISEMLLLLQ